MEDLQNFTLKRYKDIDEIMAASFTSDEEPISIEDLKGSKIGGLTGSEEEIDLDYGVAREALLEQGYWGWVDKNKTIHYWCEKEPSFEELIHFFAHEIGHETGTPDQDEFQEEMRAEGYGRTATLAYKFAEQIKQDFK